MTAEPVTRQYTDNSALLITGAAGRTGGNAAACCSSADVSKPTTVEEFITANSAAFTRPDRLEV